MTKEELTAHCAKKRREWEEIKEAKAWRESNPPTWKPVLTEQQKREFEEYSDKWNLPF